MNLIEVDLTWVGKLKAFLACKKFGVAHLKHEAATMMKKIEQLEASKRKLLGENLGNCSIEELQQLEQQLERSVSIIRARKMQVYKQQIEQLKEKGRALAAENAMLSEKFGVHGQLQRAGSNEERGGVVVLRRSVRYRMWRQNCSSDPLRQGTSVRLLEMKCE
ncbi:UNVERIFIED_CONTAM: MADS-box protein SOC1 [Sesamum calycinum]|uniref:MADS-box protein SOC1 n=1 Tax=Sesamum calycinum TaxID=2727403 RepID=A0AAW2SYK6_9LAMI